MHVSEIMSPDPITVGPGTSLGEAWSRMRKHGLRHLPVVREGYLVGVLSDRDLAGSRRWLVSHVDEELSHAPGRVVDVMSPQPITVEPRTSVAEAAALLAEWGIGSLPVVRGRELLGIVTDTDILTIFAAACRGGRVGVGADPPVDSCMSPDPEVLAPESTLSEAARKMHALDCRHLPVVENGHLVGVVSDRDLQRASARDDAEEPRASDLMQADPELADPAEPLSAAAGRMASRRIGSLPVERDGHLIGILTTTDVLEHCARALAGID